MNSASTSTPKFKLGQRVTFGREGRAGVVVKVTRDWNPLAGWRYHVKSEQATGVVGLYWERDLEVVIGGH